MENTPKHAGGRPLLFETVEELQGKIQEYFDSCAPHPEEYKSYVFYTTTETRTRRNRKGEEVEEEITVTDYTREPKAVMAWRVSTPIVPTITGLAVYLKTSRETLINYQYREEFFDTIKEAKDVIERDWEHMLQGSNVTGVIFNLKNNHKWHDKTEQELSNPDGSLRANPFEKFTDEELRALAKKK